MEVSAFLKWQVPPLDIVDVNKTFPEVVDSTRRTYAGMVPPLGLRTRAPPCNPRP